MWSSIWMQCGADSRVAQLVAEPWRAVESQHQIATRKLVDTDVEQQVLEEMIESAKPRLRSQTHLHYLLFTPFRYPPLRHGSRFGTREEPGIWYGSESQRTTFAEVAYYRFLFLAGSSADLGLVETELTVFKASVRAVRGVDLLTPPFASYEAELSSPVSYAEPQALGRSMRAAGVEAVRYRSARDREGGANVGVFLPTAFEGSRPTKLEDWHCSASATRVEIRLRGYFDRAIHTFERAEFLIDALLPAPAL
jgi:hypothetical protein